MVEVRVSERRRWAYVGVLTFLGLAMVWWGAEQFTQIRPGPSASFPPARLLGLLITLIGAGLVFGLASSPGAELNRHRRNAIAGWSLLVGVVLAAFYSVVVFNWPDPALLSSDILRFLTSPITVTGTSIALGFYLSRLAIGRAAGPDPDG